ncbi:TRAP transporter small permease subunit [Marivita sp. GX14005]|uniref:TRAP transporter small permease n=1 Tax=Marivita sp. GX14005 TaxID=2942276 RepID=UPI00201948AA|nr:TRAP transporter small permease subunit [Marivita sp. GX14005]MCL3882211.1 TRAP transporter small permease subunit [Marivita sp. GX14005]
MAILLGLLAPLQMFNDIVLRIGRAIGVVAIGLMVLAILLQVFFRYALGNAQPWPEEAARFLMLWMTGLMAPSAYRRGGFVSIDMAVEALPRRVAALLSLFLLGLAMLVLITGIDMGHSHVKSGWLFASSSLYVPLELIGMTGFKLKLAWMYLSLYVGLILLAIVNVELILRAVVSLLGGEDRLRPMRETDLAVE